MGKKKLSLIIILLLISNIALADDFREANKLISQLRFCSSDKTESAVAALLGMGEKSVPALCQALNNPDLIKSSKRDDLCMTLHVVATLSSIAQISPEIMEQSVPAIFNAMKKAPNKTLRGYIGGYLASDYYVERGIPYFIGFLKTRVENPPEDDPDCQMQSFISVVLMLMAKDSPQKADIILDSLEGSFKSAQGIFKLILAYQIVNLSSFSERTILILEEAVKSEADPRQKKKIEKALKAARDSRKQ